MKLLIMPDAKTTAQKAAEIIAGFAEEQIHLRGTFSLAISGGSTPWKMLRQLADINIAWGKIKLFQTDERIAPDGDPQRNLTQIEANLLQHTVLKPNQVQAMPVAQTDLNLAVKNYTQLLKKFCGNPPILDLIHLGLGEDGHTASLLPGDPGLNSQKPVTITNEYHGHRRMTLTYPTINTARNRLWVVTGSNKQSMLERLYHGDETIPAGLVERNNTIILADKNAAQGLELE